MSLLCRLKKLAHKGELEEKDLERIVILPKDATNGDVITAMFPNISVYEHGSTYAVNNVYKFNSTWWDSPYRKEQE